MPISPVRSVADAFVAIDHLLEEEQELMYSRLSQEMGIPPLLAQRLLAAYSESRASVGCSVLVGIRRDNVVSYGEVNRTELPELLKSGNIESVSVVSVWTKQRDGASLWDSEMQFLLSQLGERPGGSMWIPRYVSLTWTAEPCNFFGRKPVVKKTKSATTVEEPESKLCTESVVSKRCSTAGSEKRKSNGIETCSENEPPKTSPPNRTESLKTSPPNRTETLKTNQPNRTESLKTSQPNRNELPKTNLPSKLLAGKEGYEEVSKIFGSPKLEIASETKNTSWDFLKPSDKGGITKKQKGVSKSLSQKRSKQELATEKLPSNNSSDKVPSKETTTCDDDEEEGPVNVRNRRAKRNRVEEDCDERAVKRSQNEFLKSQSENEKNIGENIANIFSYSEHDLFNDSEENQPQKKSNTEQNLPSEGENRGVVLKKVSRELRTQEGKYSWLRTVEKMEPHEVQLHEQPIAPNIAIGEKRQVSMKSFMPKK